MDQFLGSFFSTRPWARTIAIALGGALVLFLLNLAVAGYRGYGFIGTSGQPTQITIMGTAERSVVPDKGTLSITVTSDATTQKTAQANLVKKTAGILDFLTVSGIASKDIKTQNYSLYPNCNGDDIYMNSSSYYPAPVPVSTPCDDSYTATQTIDVTISDIATVDALIAGVAEAGGEISYITLYASNDKQVRADLKKEAIENARQQAEEAAEALDMRVVRVITFEDYNYYDGYPMPLTAEAYPPGMPRITVSPGEQKISAQVSVTFELR